MSAVLAAQDVTYDYPGGVLALRHLSISVTPGRKLAILGPNGAGKSTLLLHLNGSLRPLSGTVFAAGRPITYDRRGLNTLRSRVALVLQNPDDQIFAPTVSEDVSFGPLNQGLTKPEAAERVQDALAALGITDLADRPTHMLSGGQKKRVAIAGAVAMKPEVLLLDEPTAGLDRQGANQLIATLDRLQGHGTTLVFSTHDIDLALSLADDVALFSGGTVLAQGLADQILSDRTLLAQAGLQPPVLIDVWLAARAKGLCAAEECPPKTVEDMIGRLSVMAEQRAKDVAN